MEVRLRRARLLATGPAVQLARRCHERCKPFLLSKVPTSSLVPPDEPRDSGRLFPAECYSVQLMDCEVVEAYAESIVLEEKRWPFRATVSLATLRSDAAPWPWDLSELLLSSVSSAASPGECRVTADQLPMGSSADFTRSGDETDVIIPKEMFDHLVHRAAEATLKESQVVAAREELQRAYITLASSRSASQEFERHAGTDPVAGADCDENERLRRKCAQLESSLHSQGLAQRRLETELAHYRTTARDELRQILCAKTHHAAAVAHHMATEPRLAVPMAPPAPTMPSAPVGETRHSVTPPR